MATYNGAIYICEQIDSILSQTVHDFELVICDDCSTDDTFKILRRYQERDERIRVYQNNKNLGFKKNFEKIIGLCSGDFVALSDQDDIWLPNHLELLIDGMTPNIQIVCGRPIFIDQNNRELSPKYDYLKMDSVPFCDEDMARHILLGNSTFQGASMLIRSIFFEKALPIPAGADYHDSWFAALACFTGGLNYLDKPIMRYRRYSSSVTVKTMRKSPFRTFLGATLVNHALLDRLVLVNNIQDRVLSLSREQKDLLNQIERILKRRKTLLGRLANVPYFLRHFKAIYTFDGKHLFN